MAYHHCWTVMVAATVADNSEVLSTPSHLLEKKVILALKLVFGKIVYPMPFQVLLEFCVAPQTHRMSKLFSQNCKHICLICSNTARRMLSWGLYSSTAPVWWRCQPHKDFSPSGQNRCLSCALLKSTFCTPAAQHAPAMACRLPAFQRMANPKYVHSLSMVSFFFGRRPAPQIGWLVTELSRAKSPLEFPETCSNTLLHMAGTLSFYNVNICSIWLPLLDSCKVFAVTISDKMYGSEGHGRPMTLSTFVWHLNCTSPGPDHPVVVTSYVCACCPSSDSCAEIVLITCAYFCANSWQN